MSSDAPGLGPGKARGGAFYLHGPDEFRKEEAARELISAHLDEATRDFNLDRLRGSEIDVEALASVLGTPPMMAEWRVVVLRETEAMAASPRARDLLVDVARKPPPGLALLLLCTPPSGSSARFYRDLARAGTSLAFPALEPDEVPGWLVDHARSRLGREITERAARALALAAGADAGLLARELEKLDGLAASGEAIDVAHVEAAGTRVPHQDRWAWLDLVGGKRFGEALTGLPVLLQHGESGVGLTLALGSHLLRLGIVVGGGQAALEAALPPRQGWLARKYVAQARRWTEDEVELAVEGLLRVDRMLKASGLSDRHLLETWLLERATPRGEAA